MKIKHITARQILDSRGNPTVEADVILENGVMGRAAVPSGASTGTNEAVELRDENPELFGGKSVFKAVNHVRIDIAKVLEGKPVEDQEKIDQTLIDLDGTSNKCRLGANAILAVSIACAKAAAQNENEPLFDYFGNLAGKPGKYVMPVPQMNIINGGKHAAGSTDIQEFMILPVGADSFSKALQMGVEVFHALGKVLSERGYATTVGDEGGYAPHVKEGNKEALDLISAAVKKAKYKLGEDIMLGLDVAASELYKNGEYHLNTEKKTLSSDEMTAWYTELVKQYPIVSLEDGLDQEDWSGWEKLTAKLGEKIQLVGDDIFVTNKVFLQRGIKEKSANAILVKLNQIGTVTETIQTVEMALDAGWHAVISHRSGETADTTIAHLAVGLATGQIKTGSLSRTDRIAKYNELLRIEQTLGDHAVYLGRKSIGK